jgi:hypothetical protein
MATKIMARDMGPKRKSSASATRANKQRRARPQSTAEPQLLPDGETPVSSDPDQALRDRHEIRRGWFMTEAHRQASNRTRMARCESMYDSDQWDYREAQDVKDRGQNPVVYNEIKPTVDWLIGMERRARVDFVVMAESDEPEADEDAANKTKLLKFLDDTNMAQFERSWAAEDAFKAGVGWLEVGLRGDESEGPIFVGAVPWRDILWDSQARRRDLGDARYLFRVKVVDLDVAEAIFPDKVEQLRKVSQSGDTLQMFAEWMGGMGMLTGLDQFSGIDDPLDSVTAKPIDMFNARKRVLLIECWSREPQRREANSDGLSDPVTFKVRVSIMTEHDTLIEAWSPFRHNKFPFVPVWGYLNRRTGLPYSPIWPLIGPQVSLNHRMSKSLFEASSNQLMLEKSAVDPEVMDVDEIRAELNSPDGIPVFRDGALGGGRVKDRDRPGAAQHQLLLAEKDSAMIRSMSGVNSDNRGERSNVTSGRAVLAKQDQGSLLTAELFDNLLFARKIEGEITLSVAEQFIVQPMMVRAGQNPKDRVLLNQPQPDGTYLNDITARRAKFVVGEQAWKQAYAEAAFESLFELLTQLAPAAPQIVVNLLDIIFDMHPNLPKKAAIVARTRQINGQADPDGRVTPEEQAAKAQQAERARQEFELQMRAMLAEVKLKEANGEKLSTQAMRERLSTLYEAAQAAQVLAQVPETAPIADELARSVGFKDQAGSDQVIDMPAQAPRSAMAQLPPTGGMPANPDPGADGGVIL